MLATTVNGLIIPKAIERENRAAEALNRINHGPNGPWLAFLLSRTPGQRDPGAGISFGGGPAKIRFRRAQP
jgi:hypothetical protein